MATWLQKKSLMDKIKVKRIKRPTPWIKPDPRTNGFNPTVLQKFKDRYSEMEAALKKPKPNQPRRSPDKVMSIENYWRDLANAIDTCPYELKQIMEGEIKPDNDLVMSYFKKFITAIKISETVDFSELNDRKRSTRKYNEDVARRFEEDVENYNHMSKRWNENASQTENEVKKTWAEICIALTEQVQRNPKIDSLGAWDRSLVQALIVRGPGFCKIDKGEIKLGFTLMKKMEPAVALETIEIASQKFNEYQDQCYRDFLDKAPIEDVERYHWDLLVHDPNDSELVLIQSAIAARRGMVLVKDRYGGYRYVDPNDLDEEITSGDAIWGGRGFFDYEDGTVLNIWREARKKQIARDRRDKLGKL